MSEISHVNRFLTKQVDHSTISSLYYLCSTIFVYWLLKNLFLDHVNETPWVSIGALALALIAAFGARRLTYCCITPALVLLIRGSTLVIGCYVSWAGIVIPPYLDEPFATLREFAPALSFAVIACTAAAMWRPVFALLPHLAAIAFKSISFQALGIRMFSRTDWFPLVELVLFSLTAILVWHFADMMRRQLFPAAQTRTSLMEFSTLIFFTAMAIHFANYFHSGVAKIALDGATFWTWPNENTTAMLAEVAFANRHAPLAHWVYPSSVILNALWTLNTPANWMVLIVQLAAIAAILHRRLSILIILLFDFLHIFIFLVTGIFFWKWILLNGILIMSIRYVSAADFRRFGWIAVLVVVASPIVFFVARLGWYDTGALNNPIILAEMRDGTKLEVPSNYFAIASITVAQNRLGNLDSASFPTGTWGNTNSNATRLGARDNCNFSATDSKQMKYSRNSEEIESFFKRFHAYRQTTLDEHGKVKYDFYPHHIWSNLFLFNRFAEADKREIIAYHYSVERLCFVRAGGLTKITRSEVGEDMRVPVVQEK